MEVTVCVPTFGERSWAKLARERAIPSAKEQTDHVLHTSGKTLAQARNAGLSLCSTEWIIYLDADDELEPGYLDAMREGTADLRAPAVRYVWEGRSARPRMPRVAGHRHACTADCLPDGNWLVVGTAARAELLRRVGGWQEFPVYEDWDLFLRCFREGATFEAIPQAIYKAHVRRDSRNRGMPIAERNFWHERIFKGEPPFATGGFVPKSSMVVVHAGEEVKPP